MNLSKKMEEALLKLYNAPRCTDYVQMSTYNALEDRGFIINTNGQVTEGGSFPMYMSQLTVTGYRYCLKKFSSLPES